MPRVAEKSDSTMHMKYLRPKEYRPPTSEKELLDRYGKGERYFEDARLHGAIRDYSTFDNVNLSRADLSAAFMRNSTLTRVDFTDARCVNTTFEKSAFYQCSFSKANLQHAYFYMTKVAFVSFFGVKMEHAQFLDCLQFARKEEKAGLLVSPQDGSTCFVSYSSIDHFADQIAKHFSAPTYRIGSGRIPHGSIRRSLKTLQEPSGNVNFSRWCCPTMPSRANG